MTLTKNRKIFQIAIGTVVLIVLVILISIIFALRSSKKDETSKIAPNKIVPPQTSQPITQSVQSLIDKLIASPLKNTNGDLLLYESNNFYIEYITSAKVFFVKIKRDPDKSKRESQKWFISKGFKQEDLCTISVRYILTNLDLRKENPTFSSLPDGCAGEPLSK